MIFREKVYIEECDRHFATLYTSKSHHRFCLSFEQKGIDKNDPY